MERRYSVRDLVSARLNALTTADAHPDLADYYGRRYAAFGAAFGAQRHADADANDFGDADRRALESLESATTKSIRALHSPFEGFMEAPRAVINLYQQHSDAVRDALVPAHAALEDLLVDVVAALYGVPVDRTIGAESLAAHGFDPSQPEPDVHDYL